jgi:hypothetical protein
MNPWLRNVIAGLVVALASGSLPAEPLRIAYCFTKDDHGGIATATVESETGKIIRQESHYETEHCKHPDKLRGAGDQVYLLTHDSSDEPYVFVVDTTDVRSSRIVELPARPDKLRVAGPLALVTCDQDWIVSIDINSRSILGMWEADKILRPEVTGLHDILLSADRRFAAISFRGNSGKKKEGRIAVFELPSMELKADVLLDRQEASRNIDQQLRLEGPGPKVMFLDEAKDLFAVTLEHYGALAIFKWSELLTGELSSMHYLPTSLDGTWGTAHTDRGTVFQTAGRTLCLVCNAGEQGGGVLVDLAQPGIVAHFDIPAGVEQPIYSPELRSAFAVCPGKSKRRVGNEVAQEFFPRNELFVFDFSDESLSNASVARIASQQKLFAVTVLPRKNAMPLLIVASGSDRADTLVTFDPASKTFLHSAASIGFVVDFADKR